MKFYSFEKIKAAADCLEIAKEIGLPVGNDGRCAATWRGGDNTTAVSINKSGFFDFVTGEHGSVIDMVAAVKYDGDHQQAQNWLGERLGLQPDMVPVSNLPGQSIEERMAANGYIETARYNYTDEVGNIAHYSVRFEHPEKGKTFRQGANGRWNIDDVRLFPYNLPAVLAAKSVFICEGEKAAQAIIDRGGVATTNASGAGKWRAEYSEYFRGKYVCIIPDNDAPGKEHAAQVAKSILPVAASVCILPITQIPKGDVYDWFEHEGGDINKLFTAAAGMEPISYQQIESAKDIKPESDEIRTAKKANRYEFRNYINIEETVNGKQIVKKDPIHTSRLVNDVNKRFLGFPRRVGSQLFDHDKDTHELFYIHKPASLFSWIARKSGQRVSWGKGESFVSKEEFFESVHAEALRYEAVSLVPDWPRREDVYYSHKPIPAADPDHKYFEQFVDFFNPATPEFRTALKAFVMSPVYYRKNIPRPLWVIDSERPGSGKTMLANMVSQLYGRPPIEIKKKDFGRDMQEVTKRLVSTEGRLSRMLLVDNVTGTFSSEELAGLITMPYITGRPSHGRNEESRPNNLTYVVTANNATIDNDLAIRSYFIRLNTVKYDPGWNGKVHNFIERYRLNIIADIIDILNSHKLDRFDVQPCTRCPEFETEVLQAVCGTIDEYDAVIKAIISTRQAANIEEEWGKEVEDAFRHEIIELGINPDQSSVWIRSGVVTEWISRAFPDLRTNAIQFVRDLSKTGYTQRLSCKWATWPHNGSERRRGVLWLNSNESETVAFVAAKSGSKISYISTGYASDAEI